MFADAVFTKLDVLLASEGKVYLEGQACDKLRAHGVKWPIPERDAGP